MSATTLLGAAGAVLGSWTAVKAQRADAFDGVVARIRRPRGNAVDRTVGTLTDLGSVYGLLGTSAALAAGGRRRAALDVLGGGALAWGIAQAAKVLLPRDRPYLLADVPADRIVSEPSGTSWPSGHTAVAAAIATSVAAHSDRPVAASATAVGLTAFVATSRVYAGVHHGTDTVAGAGFGVLSVAAWQGLRRLARRDG